MHTIKTTAPLEHIVKYYESRGFEKCKSAPTDKGLVTKVIFGGDLEPSYTTRLILGEDLPMDGTPITPKIETRYHAIFEETMEIMTRASGYRIPDQTIIHNFHNHLSRHPSSSNVYNNKNARYIDTSEFVLLVRIYRDAVGVVQGVPQ